MNRKYFISCLEREVSSDEAVSIKKLKVADTNSSTSRLASCENSFIRISEWADHILKRIENGIENLDIVDKQLLLEETEAEVNNEHDSILIVIREGEQLIKGKKALTITNSLIPLLKLLFLLVG